MKLKDKKENYTLINAEKSCLHLGRQQLTKYNTALPEGAGISVEETENPPISK